MAGVSRTGTKQTSDTRSKRVDAQTVRQYLGNGPKAREAARRCDQIRWLRQFERDHQAKHRLWLAECVRACDEFYELIDVVYRAEMAAAGYHYHRGEWRKRRLWQEEPVAAEPRSAESTPQTTVPPNNSAQQPRRRQMPLRRGLDCRCPLVRGAIRWRRTVNRPKPGNRHMANVSTWLRPRRIAIAIDRRSAGRTHAERSAEIGSEQQPRPPPQPRERPQLHRPMNKSTASAAKSGGLRKRFAPKGYQNAAFDHDWLPSVAIDAKSLRSAARVWGMHLKKPRRMSLIAALLQPGGAALRSTPATRPLLNGGMT